MAANTAIGMGPAWHIFSEPRLHTSQNNWYQNQQLRIDEKFANLVKKTMKNMKKRVRYVNNNYNIIRIHITN